MNNKVKKEIESIIEAAKYNGLKWKFTKEKIHLKKRKRKGQIPSSWTLKDCNEIIRDICTGLNSEVYLYNKKYSTKKYYVFGDRKWITIIGVDKVIETAFPPDYYSKYLSEEEGYKYLGSVKEVLYYE